MPVARSLSASQLSRELQVSPANTPTEDGMGPPLLQQKAHTLDRFSKSHLINGHSDSRRKRTFMSFRLSKKSGKRKECEAAPVSSNSSNNNNNNSSSSANTPSDGGDGLDGGGSDSSSAASVKPKRRHLTRVGSFVRRVASRVQAAGPAAVVATAPARPDNKVEGGGGDAVTVVSPVAVPAQEYVLFVEDKVPAVMGLRNHGNTCFVNATVQCLSHTDVLAEYFVLDAYKQDLRRCNRMGNRKTLGGARRGEMTEQVAGVLKALWSLRYVPDVSLALKACVDKHEASYRGGSQHDAAEFLMFLLGKVHDDLNTASKRKYKKIKNSYGRPDEVVASETLNNHLRCNSSFVQDIFQAQFRSSLRCPHCHKESNTFDPFMCVSLPIPHREVMPLYVTIVYLNQQPKQVCLGLSVVCGSNVGELRCTVAQDCGLDLDTLIVTEVDGAGFHRSFADDCSVDCLDSGASVHAIELPGPAAPDQGPFLLITWVNVVTAQPDNIRFGGVYQSQVARDITYQDLQKLLLKEMTTMVTAHTLTTQQQCGLFRVHVCDGSASGTSVACSVELPLYSQCVDQALALCCPPQPQHIKLILHWRQQDKDKYIVDDVDHVQQHSSVHELKKNPLQPPPTTLADCLKLHSSAEQLSSGDAWHCPTCDRKQQGVKRLMLWSAPQILVLHLKRFRQSTMPGSSSSKLSTYVSFPLHNVDISEYVAQRSQTRLLQENTKNCADTGVKTTLPAGVWSPWRKPKRQYAQQLDDKHVYDLYAVCNHHGKDLQGGHYTAMCHNPSSGEWYQFDDSRVKQLQPDQVVSQDAYLLFYQRRNNGSSSSVESRPNKQHWGYRIPRDSLPASLNPPLSQHKNDQEVLEDVEDTGVSSAATSATTANTTSTVTKSSTTTPASSGSTVPAVFCRGRSYGTLPGHGRAAVTAQDSLERENCSDSEAPLAGVEDSPVKRKRISDVQERRESEVEEEEERVSPMETSVPASPALLLTEQRPTATEGRARRDSAGARQDTEAAHSRKTDGGQGSKMEVNGYSATTLHTKEKYAIVKGSSKIDTVIESNLERSNSSGSKTVLISRCQAADVSDGTGCSCPQPEHHESRCSRAAAASARHSLGDSSVYLQPPVLSLCRPPVDASHPDPCLSRSTPDVVIQPASPAVLAAHKRSIITVTLRPRSPSISSQPCVSRSPSSCSNTSRTSVGSRAARQLSDTGSVTSFTPETLASIITVNGVTLADNEQLSAEFASSLAVAAATGEESVAACGCGAQEEGKGGAGAVTRPSLRSSPSNKTASYVHVSAPAVKTRVTNGRSPTAPKGRVTPPAIHGSGRATASTNGYTNSAPNMTSKNCNTAKTALDSVPCKNKCSKPSVAFSARSADGYPSSNMCSVTSSKDYSESVMLRNNCGNFVYVDGKGDCGCSCKNQSRHNGCSHASSSSLTAPFGEPRGSGFTRHSSTSLDGSSRHHSSSGGRRSRYSSECSAYGEGRGYGCTCRAPCSWYGSVVCTCGRQEDVGVTAGRGGAA